MCACIGVCESVYFGVFVCLSVYAFVCCCA